MDLNTFGQKLFDKTGLIWGRKQSSNNMVISK